MVLLLVFMQLTRDLFAIANFLFTLTPVDSFSSLRSGVTSTKHSVRRHLYADLDEVNCSAFFWEEKAFPTDRKYLKTVARWRYDCRTNARKNSKYEKMGAKFVFTTSAKKQTKRKVPPQ